MQSRCFVHLYCHCHCSHSSKTMSKVGTWYLQHLYYKQWFAISGNPLPCNIGPQWHLYYKWGFAISGNPVPCYMGPQWHLYYKWGFAISGNPLLFYHACSMTYTLLLEASKDTNIPCTWSSHPQVWRDSTIYNSDSPFRLKDGNTNISCEV